MKEETGKIMRLNIAEDQSPLNIGLNKMVQKNSFIAIIIYDDREAYFIKNHGHDMNISGIELCNQKT